MFRGKKYQDAAKQIEKNTQYDAAEGFGLICKTASAKFDETVELHVKLGVDSRHADQQVRGAIVLPNGTGKTARVLVFAKGDKADAAREAGADYVGEMDMVEKIQKENWFDFDVVVASPDMMGVVGRLGKLLGPKGLMPSPKAGTVTPDVAKAVKEVKAGKVEYRLDKTNIIHCPIGKVSFGAEKLTENLSEAQADSLLRCDLERCLKVFRKYGKDSLLLSLLGFNVGCYRLIGNGKIPKSRLIQKLESGDRDIYREYISFRCYQGKVIPSIERRRKEEFELFYIP